MLTTPSTINELGSGKYVNCKLISELHFLNDNEIGSVRT